MFNDYSFEPVGFPSQASTDKSQTEVSSQTDEIARQDSETQLLSHRNVQVQTVDQNKPTHRVDYDKLAEFLKRVTPSVLNELDEIYGSTAFDDYDPGPNGEPSTSVKPLVKFDTMDELDPAVYPDFVSVFTKIERLLKKISCVSWSPGGGTLALSYSATSHDTWCEHVSRIKFYNFTKEDQFSTASSPTSLELNACVTALSYHPTEPSILAAGLFNGDVLVWNLRDDESLSPLQLPYHGDSLSVIQWRPKLVNNVSPLVTVGRDGYILVHKLTANFTTVDLHQRFKISKEHNPSEKTRPRSASGRRERAVEPGLSITAHDYFPKDPNIFVVGTLCGGLYRCNIDQAIPIEGSSDTLDPVIDEFERHQGSVTSVIFSPSCETFVTSGTDKEIRIYDLSQFNSQHVISVEDTAIGLSWLIGNTNIFAAYGAGRTIAFYNLKIAKTVPNLSFETRGNETSCLEFNAKRDLVAFGNTTGNLEIWKVPQNIVF